MVLDYHLEEEDAMRAECRKSLRTLSMGSAIFNDDDSILEESCSNRLKNEAVEVGNVLGMGCFSSVQEFKGLRVKQSSTRSLPSELSETEGSSTKMSDRKYFYAVKRLRDDLSKALHEAGARDLAIEAQFLTSLSHPNIVSLQAHGDDPGSKGFFIIIERVERTLAEEIRSWKYRRLLNETRCSAENGGTKKKLKNLLLNDRILPFALDITSALSYLHGKNILFRDLKTDNIGIDFEDKLKLFDFGLATELRPAFRVGPNKYKCSIAGTRRYMSPEAIMGKEYGLPADVYSFAILLNEMISQKKPFAGATAANHKRSVGVFRQRPAILKTCPRSLKRLIQSAWTHNPDNRPNIQVVNERLESYISKDKHCQ